MKFPLSLMILPHILTCPILRLRSLYFFLFILYTSAHPFIFNLSESLCFRYVFCIEHRDGFCFFSQSENYFLLIGVLHLFTFIEKRAMFGVVSVMWLLNAYCLCTQTFSLCALFSLVFLKIQFPF